VFTDTLTISGSSQSISSQLSNSAPKLTTFATGGSSGGNVSSSGTPTAAQVAIWVDATHIEGLTLLPASAFPALTGDVTNSAGSLATTLATVNSNVGSFTNANITVDAKGRITAAANGTAGGPGTGTANCLGYWASTSTLGSICGTVTGQVFAAVNGSHPVAASSGIVGRTVTTNSDTVLCDTSTSVNAGDRGKTIEYTFAGSVAVTLPNPAATGCGSNTQGDNNFYFGALILGSSTSVTFTPASGTINGQSSLTLTQGNVSISSPDNVNYIARASNFVKAGSGLTATLNADGTITYAVSAVPLSALATQAADTVVMNASGSSAAPTAVAMPTSGTNGCAGASNALTYNTTSHALGCNTISGATPATRFSVPGYGNGNEAITANELFCGGVSDNFNANGIASSVGHITFQVSAAATSLTSSVGYYSLNGTTATLRGTTGVVNLSSTGSGTLALTGVTGAPSGPLLFCATSGTGSTLQLATVQVVSTFFSFQQITGVTTSLGVLPSTFTYPGDSPTTEGNGALAASIAP
jgi:hypothetical protein